MNTRDELAHELTHREEVLPLSQLLHELEADRCKILITDILLGQTNLWEPFLKAEHQNNERVLLLYSLPQLGFNFLASRDAAWLDQYADTIESLFVSCLQGEPFKYIALNQLVENSPHSINKEGLMQRIKSLVAIAGGGMREEFLTRLLNLENLERGEKLDIYLLIAKLQEKRSQLDLNEWEDKLKVFDNPELLPVWVYVCRRFSLTKVTEALAQVEFITLVFEFTEKEMQYLQTYLIQAIYNYLQGDAQNENYHSLINFYSFFKSAQSKIKDCIMLAMESPALSDAIQGFNQYMESIENPKQDQQRQELEKTDNYLVLRLHI